MPLLAFATLALSAIDHWTTYLCLREPFAGWEVTEANPLSSWLFQTVGLVPGLLVDSALTIAAVVFLLKTTRLPLPVKHGFLGLVVLATAVAVVNNYRAIDALGISVLGIG
ncbi:MAG TPA: hypothetical protein VEC18_08890 [Myxococcota bacterium]|nr:hypothetical protein [Myxococcota bacterium]